MTTCPTITRLSDLRKGQSLIYYKGDLGRDIERAAIEAPGYASILSRIQATATDLQAIGRLELAQRPVDRIVVTRDKFGGLVEHLIQIVEYSATGR